MIEFNEFGTKLWDIANVFRDDTLKTTEYLEEFSYFLFLKLYDYQDEERVVAGLEPIIPENLRFRHWVKNPEKWAEEQGFKGTRKVVEFIQHLFDELADLDLKGDELDEDRKIIQKIFKNHTLRVRYDATIRELCSRLDMLEIPGIERATYDLLGRAYEFVVDKLGEQKQYGQYFTPRHIVRAMVDMIDPEIGEKVYDPAAGTGGFLVWAFMHLREKVERISDGAVREPKLREIKRSLYGIEKAPDVYKLGIMNLILHGDGSSNFNEGDSLSPMAQDKHKETYNAILTNVPFGPTAQDRTAQFRYHARLYEVLFLQHIMNALAPGGRAAVVIKEGLLFASSKNHLGLRGELLDRYNVRAVISLPSGVFNPYSGTKTSILIFEKPKEKGGTTKRVWFFRVDHDGFDLGATRREIDKNDLPELKRLWEIIKRSGWRELPVTEKSWVADVDEIRKNEYNLTANKYAPRDATREEFEPPQTILTNLMTLEEEITLDLDELQGMLAEVQG